MIGSFVKGQCASQAQIKWLLITLVLGVTCLEVIQRRIPAGNRAQTIHLIPTFPTKVTVVKEDLISRKLSTNVVNVATEALMTNNALNQDKACTRFAWIDQALDHFFKPAAVSAAKSTQTVEESLQAMHNLVWDDQGYQPGQDLIILSYDSLSDSYIITPHMVHPPNLAFKQQGVLSILTAAVSTHQAPLKQALKGRTMKFVITTEDFGLVWREAHSKLPAFSLSTDPDHIDIPIPDFTFATYPEARYVNTSWPVTAALLHAKSKLIPWSLRHPDIFHRSNWDVGPRKSLMPILEALHANGSDVGLFGAELNVADSGFGGFKRENFVWLDEWCGHKYHIHTAGFSYSAGLKYKLACGGMVFKVESPYQEFYEPALEGGVHFISLPWPASEDAVQDEDLAELIQSVAAKTKPVVEATLEREGLPGIAAAGQLFVLEQLTPEALECYWLGALLRYADLYFAPDTRG